MGRMTDFYDQFRGIIIRHKRVGYDSCVMWRSACIVVSLVSVDGFAAHFDCTPVAPTWGRSFWLVGTGVLSPVAWSAGARLVGFQCFRFPAVLFGRPGSPLVKQHIVSVGSSSLLLRGVKT